MIPLFVSLPLLIQSVTVRGTSYPVKLATQVGHPYDTRVIDEDVHRLWSTSRFDDVRVETTAQGGVVFDVVEAREPRLHEIRVEPPTPDLQLKVPASTPITRLRAHEIALQARRQLNARGYLDAQVDYDLVPFAANEADLRLTLRKGDVTRVKEVEFVGDSLLEPKELHRPVEALRVRHILFWPFYPSYSPEAAESDAAHVQSLYVSKGFLDAKVRAGNLENGRVAFLVKPGQRYTGSPRDLCSSLFAAHRKAESEGILDFSAALVEDMTVRIDRGKPYRIGRIEFRGNHHVSDSTLRRNFVLDEGDLLDQRLLRKSVERLNRMQLFEPIRMSDIMLRSDEKTGIADIGIQVTERKRGAWNLSGPVGPASIAGPLQASISARLPSWGRGIFELSTYSASVSLFAFVQPILPAWAIASKHPLLPILALHRPFTPTGGWMSGWTFAPQFGWRASAISYATVQIQQRTLPRLARDHGLEPELVVKVERPGGDVPMFCEPPQPRLMWLRRTASLSVQFLGALATF